MDRVPAQHSDKGEHKEAQHQEDLEDRQIELGDAKVPDRYYVQNGIEYNHGDNDGFDGDFIRPEGYHNVHGDNLKWHEEGHVQEEVPGHGEAESTVDPLGAEPNERRRDGNKGDHFGKAFVDGPHDSAPDDEGDEKAGRTTLGKSRAHLYVEGLKSKVHLC